MSDITASSFRTRMHLTKQQRLPQYIKDAEKIIRSVKTCRSNFKTLMANSRLRGQHYKKVYSLTFNVLKYYDYVQTIIEKIKLLQKEKMLRSEVASILIYEIVFGNGNLTGESKPILTIQKYKSDIIHAHQELQNSDDVKIKELNIPRYARVHTLVTTVPYVIKDLECQGYQQIFYNDDISEIEYLQFVKSLRKKSFLVDLHFKDLLVFAYNENLVQLQLYSKGHIFLQDKSSYIPVHALNPEPGSAVLDACAAPGMKSVHLAAKMQNKGLLIACEKNAERFETLKEMLQHGTVKISKMFCKDFKLIDPSDQAYSSVDYILVDPSCSGSGMVNRMDQVTNTDSSKNKERLEKLAGFQIILLKHALKFSSVKRVVYSTCSINEEENEYVVHEALNAFRDTFKLVPVFPEWPGRGLTDYKFGKLCLRTIPEKHLTNGFFVAMFERLDYTEQCKNYEIFQKKSEKFGIEGNYDSEELKSSESLHKAKRSKRTEIDTCKDIDNSKSERKKSKKRNSKLQTELEDDEIIDKSVNSVSHKKQNQNKIDSEKNYNNSIEGQETELEYQEKNDSFEKYSVKPKKNKKHKYADNSDLKSFQGLEDSHIIAKEKCSSIQECGFLENTNSKKRKHFQTSDTMKNENISDISYSHGEVIKQLRTETISDNREIFLQDVIVEANSTGKSSIQQSLCSVNETAGSIEDSLRKHKKSKKHKKHSHDIVNDICNDDIQITEYTTEKNIDSFENCPMKHKKSKKHKKHSQDIVNDICNDDIQITEYTTEKNIDSFENCPMKHKKSKKHKKCSEDIVNDYCNNDIQVTEHISQKNIDSPENCSTKYKKNKKLKNPQDYINDIYHNENLVAGECVLEMKKNIYTKYPADLQSDMYSGETHNIAVNNDSFKTLQMEESETKCEKSKFQFLPSESSKEHDNFANDDLIKQKKSKKHKKHSHNYFDKSQEPVKIFPNDKIIVDSCDIQTNIVFTESVTKNSDNKYHNENILGNESGEKDRCKKNKHKKHSKDFDNSQESENLLPVSNKISSDVCDMQESTPPIFTVTENVNSSCIKKNVFDLDDKIKHKHKKSKRDSKQFQDL